jgi:thiamine-phosphate pyrophosphorylase
MRARYAKNLPSIWLMTDERVAAEALLKAAARLPRGGGGVVFRHYRTGKAERRALFDRLAAIARPPSAGCGMARGRVAWAGFRRCGAAHAA